MSIVFLVGQSVPAALWISVAVVSGLLGLFFAWVVWQSLPPRRPRPPAPVSSERTPREPWRAVAARAVAEERERLRAEEHEAARERAVRERDGALRAAAESPRHLVETDGGWIVLVPESERSVSFIFYGEDGWSRALGQWNARLDGLSLPEKIALVCELPQEEAERVVEQTMPGWREAGGVDRARNERKVIVVFVLAIALVLLLATTGVGFLVWRLVLLF